MRLYYDIDGRPIPDYPMDSRESRRVGLDEIGEVRISTVHLVLDHRWDHDHAPLIFETMIFGGEQDEWQCRWATKENAAAGHRATVAWVLHEGPEPEGDYAMTRAEWEASR